MSQFPSLRHAMTWIHTWVGLVTGYLLAAIFFFGTLSVFDREFDRWAIPETRFAAQAMPSWQDVLAPAFARIERLPALTTQHPGATLRLTSAGAFRTRRDPIVTLYPELVAEYPDGRKEPVAAPEIVIDARTGKPLPSSAFAVGTKLFYPLHIHFQLGDHLGGIGYWLVGLAAMGMLIGIVSGVVIHRRLVAELFTFRPWTSVQRVTLDLHDVTGVVALPFHVMFALTGLIVFANIYFPVADTIMKPLAARHATREPYATVRAQTSAPLASVDAMMQEAERRWSGDAFDVGYLVVRFPGDANASVSTYRAGKDRVTMDTEGIHFSGTTGEVISEEPPPTALGATMNFLTAIHLQPFQHWTLRWLYVGGGLAGCVCLATGMIFFVRKRRRKHPGGARWANAFATGAVTGPVVASLVLLVANRALPPALPTRVEWQEALFWCAWLAAFAHGAWRSDRAWREQCYGIAVLAMTAVVLNALTTGDHLVRTLVTRRYLPVAGVDLVLLVTGVVASVAARTLLRPRASSHA